MHVRLLILYIIKACFCIFKDEYKEMKQELMKCWEKDRTSEQIFYLMRDSFGSRRVEMKGYVGRPMYKLCENFPMLTVGKYVSIHMAFLMYYLCGGYE